MLKKTALAFCLSVVPLSLGLVNISSAATPEKEWTFLIYLNGNNNLDSYGTLNINQMEEVGTTEDINVVVQWASASKSSTSRLLVLKDSNTTTVTSPEIANVGAVDMGDWHSLVDFIQWGVTNFPAKHYLIDVWDHGSGWHGRNRNSSMQPLDISWDDNTGHSINTMELGKSLQEAAKIIGHKVDIYGSDACLMAMAEVAGEMRDSVNYYVGSQDLEPGQGWPYNKILESWNKVAKTADPSEIAKIVADEYAKAYMGGIYGKEDVTFSAFDLNTTDGLYEAIGTLNNLLTKLDAPTRKKVVDVIKKTQSFYYKDYRDLSDLVDQLEKSAILSQASSETFTGIRKALKSYILASAASPYFKHAQGLSLWLPTSKSTYNLYSNYYGKLKLQAETKWGDTLSYLFQD